MSSIDVSNLTFVDVSEETRGSFVRPENLDAFLATPLGEAQRESMVEEMIAQKAADGISDYKPTEDNIRRALFTEQASQDYGRTPDVTSEQMLDDHGPGWLQELGSLMSNWGSKADKVIKDATHDGVDAVVGHVTTEGMAGEAAEALMNADQRVDDALKM